MPKTMVFKPCKFTYSKELIRLKLFLTAFQITQSGKVTLQIRIRTYMNMYGIPNEKYTDSFIPL